MSQQRHSWKVLDEKTREPLTATYYSGGAVIKLARRFESEGRAIVVIRDDREYRWKD